MSDFSEDREFGRLMDEAIDREDTVIIIFRDNDGNWRGAKGDGRTGKVYERAVGPETVLQLLLTHDGN